METFIKSFDESQIERSLNMLVVNELIDKRERIVKCTITIDNGSSLVQNQSSNERDSSVLESHWIRVSNMLTHRV